MHQDIASVFAYLQSKKGATYDYPFDDDVRVYRVGNKIFALLKAQTPISINLKCEPTYALELRSLYASITGGYHMNKKHWNTVEMVDEVNFDLLKELIDHSYTLKVNSLSKKEKALIDAEYS